LLLVYLYTQVEVKPMKPLYLTIEDHIRTEIARGGLGKGGLLPSEQQLAQRFATTRNTVRQALARLAFEGTVTREKGRGTFVSAQQHQSEIDTRMRKSFEEQMAEHGEEVRFRLLSFGPKVAPDDVAARLRLRRGATVFELRRLRLIEDELIGAECRYILPELARSFDEESLRNKSTIAMVEQALGDNLADLEITVSATTADRELATLLECPRGSPVLLRDHIFWDRVDRPVLSGKSVFRGDRYRFTYHLGKSPPFR
jgi:GntR family transcriptional regulator